MGVFSWGFPSSPGMAAGVALVIALLAVCAALVSRWLTPHEVEPFLSRSRKSITLIDRSEVSPDTRRFVFALDRQDRPLGLPVCQHIVLYGPNRRGKEPGKWNGRDDPETEEEISRKYTPVSSVDARGKLELVVKVYASNALAQFPDGGKMSQHLDGLGMGDQLQISGPYGLIRYRGWGAFDIGQRRVNKAHVGLLTGGTGITPAFQLIRRVLEYPSDATKLYLIYANKSEDDILLRDELEEYESQYPDRLRVWFTLDSAPEKWRYSRGHITADMIRQHLPAPGEDVMVLCCGPPPMVEFACKSNLRELGYRPQDIACF